MRDCDVVVIGAGLGGLSASAFLAVAGKKVLLLEQHNVPGGYASSFRRGRFEFEISLHELSGLGHPDRRGSLWRLLERCDVAHRVEFLPVREFYRSVFPDVDVTLPATREGFEETLCRAFPEEAEGIKRVTALIFDTAREAVRANREGPEVVARDPAAFPNLLSCMGRTVDDVLRSEVSDERARAVIAQTWGYYCNPPDRLSFLVFALSLASYLRFGPAHIKGRSQALSQAFVDSIEERGGNVWLNSAVTRILVAEGKVRGVVTQDGTEIACPYVVCNVNPFVACLNLIGRENIPSWYLRRLGAGSGGLSTFNVYLGLDCPPERLGVENYEVFINLGYDFSRQYESMVAGPDGDPLGMTMATYSALDQSFSPPGTTAMVLVSVSRADPWLKLSPSQYVQAKESLANKLLDIAEKLTPDIRDHLEVVEVATPLTNMRYTANVAGSIIGFDETFQGTGMQRLPNRGPLEGLYFAGAWAGLGGGFEPSMVSGYVASSEVLQDMQDGGRSAKIAATLQRTVEQQAGGSAEADLRPVAPLTVVASRLHPKRIALRVAEIIDETTSARTLRLAPVDGELPHFRAGQYVNVFVNVDGVHTSRPYSISSPPGRPHYDITVRRVPDGFVSSHLLDRVKVGDVLETTGPNGTLYYEPLMDTSQLVFLAGGSGITPFVSIIRDVNERQLPLGIHLIYGSRTPSDIIFGEELKKLERSSRNLRVDFVISEPPDDWRGLSGLLDITLLSSIVGTTLGKTFYICGPAPMYPLCEAALADMGVPSRRIRREVYGPPADVAGESGWPPDVSTQAEFNVVEERSGRVFKARAGEPLMNSLERVGIVIPAVCRAGECSACRTRLLEGRVFVPSRVQRRWSDEVAGYIHPCMTYPLEDLRIRV